MNSKDFMLKDSAVATWDVKPPAIAINLLKDNALSILKDLAKSKIISFAKLETPKVNWRKFRGSLSKQNSNELDKELTKLRNEWERDIF